MQIKKKIVHRNLSWCAVLGMLIGMVLLTLLIPRSDVAVAANNVQDCINESDAPDVESVQNACDLCFTRGSGRGALWINNQGYANSTQVNARTLSGTVDFTLFGRWFACGTGDRKDRFAYYIWFGETDQMKGNGYNLEKKVSWIEPFSKDDKLYRGKGTGSAYSWNGGTPTTLVGTFDVGEFFRKYYNTDVCSVDTDTDTVSCTYKVSINRCANTWFSTDPEGPRLEFGYRNTNNRRESPGDGNINICYGDNSTVNIILEPDCSEEDCPWKEECVGDCCDYPDQVCPPVEDCTADDSCPEDIVGEFYSRSTVEVIGRDGVDNKSVTSQKDKKALLQLSADDANVTLKFTHKMYYDIDTSAFAEDDEVPDACTNLTGKTDNVAGMFTEEDYCVDSKEGDSSGTVKYTKTVTVPLSDSGRVEVCSTLSYAGKFITYSVETDHDGEGGHADDHDYYIYKTSSSGEGKSAACAIVVKPADPTGSVSIGTSLPVVYAGQASNAVWNVNALGVDERRLTAMQGLVYMVDVGESASGSLAGDFRRYYNSTPCSYISGMQNGAYACTVVANVSDSFDPEYVGAKSPSPNSLTLQTPDEVGHKYCDSFGYRLRFWWGRKDDFEVDANIGSVANMLTWSEESGSKSQYWYVFGSACRSIAKRPSMALWNGGLFTNGDILTLTSTRYLNPSVGAVAAGDVLTFGSWAEDLVVAGGVIDQTHYMASGGALGRGSSVSDAASNSPLTIANNTDELGNSQISQNSAFFTRLQTYLWNNSNNAEQYVGDAISSSTLNLGTDIGHTRIINVSGNLVIDKDIVLASGPYNSIYELPQVILRVGGNIEIKSDVRQIDAWLIVENGNINTCNVFNNLDSTQAETITYAGLPYNPDYACSRQLVINGPVIAKSVTLNRTYGSDPKVPTSTYRYDPAEVFNLSADTYLWAHAQAGRYNSSYAEAYTRELPPRV